MRVRIMLAVVGALSIAAAAAAQTTTGTISGRVIDAQGGALPGATVSAKSPNLQGTSTRRSPNLMDHRAPSAPDR